MKHFKIILLAVAAICISDNVLARTPKQKCDREYWTELAYRMAQPVLENMACGKLQKNMQTEFAPSFDSHNRKVIYMEAFGRLMAGIAHGCLCLTTIVVKGGSATSYANGHWHRTKTHGVDRLSRKTTAGQMTSLQRISISSSANAEKDRCQRHQAMSRAGFLTPS